jgi:phosphoribosylglycinamide formyltransferase-1
MDSSNSHRLVIFASGTGTNAKAIIDHFRNTNVKVSLIVSNKPDAGVLHIAAAESINTIIYLRDHANWNEVSDLIAAINPTLIVLAGYLLKIPADLIQQYQGRIINIHPALLPAYGGKGMYGNNVHNAVIASGDKQSGITIHLVDEHYDNGAILVQARCPVAPTDTPNLLAATIHKLEHFYYPRAIEFMIKSRCN